MPTPLQVLNWDVTGYQKVAENASHIADTCIAASNDMHGTIYDLAWKGEARYAAESRADREQTQMRAIAIAYDNLSSACAGAVRDMTGPIDDIKTIFRNYVRPPITVGDDWSIDGVEDWNSEAGIQLSRLAGLVEALVTYDAHWGALISQANRELEATAPAPVLAAAYAEIVSAQATDPRADPERIRTSAAAFQQVFGRAPGSPTDWATAEVLNPNSYSPKYNGVSPEIVVGRINPVPGQGSVRSAFYIPAAQVTNLPEYDLGDNRQEDPYFDPEHARVVTYVDYENGIIVTRQNPSVTVDGDVKVDRPEVEAQQLKDGSVLVRYDAVNPFAPPGSSLSGHSVNGEIVFAPESGNPGTARIVAGGLITDYPSVEIYQDNSAGTARPVLIDAADSGSQWGPLFNLPFHHEVGGGTAMFDPFRADFSQPDWQRNAPTQLGSVHNPPSVVVVTK
ncbi:hypothetical protein FOH10_07450 [Nocardia otitidiscaviarum]|uniref:WXG100 family type VII secretion target n=1 Tax=Nocardia otitidiscaviarum TaxID=1823 RepID=A0A516NI68_9NOCA|nr:hypothetical protein [Nocardia otitidiscaviarum]MCP9619916.1 hypothetical protein [Nocardia otitidiscaviarum]QDP78601.1 hypothetical protein FOH10_07450 [Nocardia otitidiscaviarum]